MFSISSVRNRLSLSYRPIQRALLSTSEKKSTRTFSERLKIRNDAGEIDQTRVAKVATYILGTGLVPFAAFGFVIYTFPMFKKTREGFDLGMSYPVDTDDHNALNVLFTLFLGGAGFLSGAALTMGSVDRVMKSGKSEIYMVLRTPLSLIAGSIGAALCYVKRARYVGITPAAMKASIKVAKAAEYSVAGLQHDMFGPSSDEVFPWERDGMQVHLSDLNQQLKGLTKEKEIGFASTTMAPSAPLDTERAVKQETSPTTLVATRKAMFNKAEQERKLFRDMLVVSGDVVEVEQLIIEKTDELREFQDKFKSLPSRLLNEREGHELSEMIYQLEQAIDVQKYRHKLLCMKDLAVLRERERGIKNNEANNELNVNGRNVDMSIFSPARKAYLENIDEKKKELKKSMRKLHGASLSDELDLAKKSIVNDLNAARYEQYELAFEFISAKTGLDKSKIRRRLNELDREKKEMKKNAKKLFNINLSQFANTRVKPWRNIIHDQV